MEGAEFDGEVLERGGPDYEVARRATVWNARAPDRFPDVIVRAASEEDVVRAVRYARERALRVAVRSGGHSWAGNHVREGGLLLDVAALREVTVDAEDRTATVQPGLAGNELAKALAEHGLFFPAGHCPGVGIGGYLLQGGFGWNGRVHGPACMSVEAIDVVDARGELVRADEHENPDLFWAARGAGPGFFGAVTRFHLRVYPRPKVVANGIHLYPIEALDDVFRWAKEIGPEVPRAMEMMLVIHRDARGELEIVVTGPTLVDTEEEAREILGLLETCPALDRAKASAPFVVAELDDLYAGVHASYPDAHRYAVDNMWTHAPIDDLLPGLRRIAETMPGAPSHMLWMNWGPSPERPDMAYSVEDETYVANYAVWTDPAEDEANVAWATERMRELEPLASGIQLADENLGLRPGRFVTAENLARLDELRAAHDPDGLFHPWMGRP